MPTLRRYEGSARKLVLGIDVGTTYSGVSYAILDPGEVPKIEGVRRFPGQENAAGDTKIPSILYYNPDGSVHSAGAEAAVSGMKMKAEDDGLILVEWFKLHMRPAHLQSDGDAVSQNLRPLPLGKKVVDVFADFLSYLFRCTRTYIAETYPNGERLLNSLADRIEFVLPHPNGWEGLQQGKMRDAAIKAGLIPDTAAGHARVRFVTEGEASLNFCIQNGFTEDAFESGASVMIIDAGGGTVDISSYAFLSKAPVSVEEVVKADCLLQGSTRVNVRAEKFLRARLKDSEYGNDEDIRSMLEEFDKSTKPVFKNPAESSHIKFGSMRCNDPRVNIRRGQLTLSGAEMESFFMPSIDAIIEVVQAQRQAAGKSLSTVFLVGGYAASPWLYTTLNRKLTAIGLRLFRPDTHTSKAVAEGGVSFYLENFVSVRAMLLTYGTNITIPYCASDPDHYARRAEIFARPSGRIVLPKAFSIIIQKGQRMREGQEVSSAFFQEAHHLRTLNSIVSDVICYRGKESNPRWTDIRPEMFTPLCTISADTSMVHREPKNGSNGVYYVQNFDIILICGHTELQAQIRWTENGLEKRGPASIVYEGDLQVSR